MAFDDEDVLYKFKDDDGNLLHDDSPLPLKQNADPPQSSENQPYDDGHSVDDAASETPGSDHNQQMNLKSKFFAATICMVATDDSSTDDSYISSNDVVEVNATPSDEVSSVDPAPVSQRILKDEATVHEGEACLNCVQTRVRCLFIKFVDEDGDMVSTKCTNCDRLGMRTCLKISGARYARACRKVREQRRKRTDRLVQRQGVPMDQKCHRYRTTRMACNGKTPCDTCLATKSKRVIKACGSEQGPQAEKCDRCL